MFKQIKSTKAANCLRILCATFRSICFTM